jgi:hypothetical protein
MTGGPERRRGVRVEMERLMAAGMAQPIFILFTSAMNLG